MDSSERDGRLLAHVNDLLDGIDHSARSNSKYREFERYLASLVDCAAYDVYTAYISKAGNAAVRFNQSERSRAATFLIALVDPPEHEPVERTVQALAKYCGQNPGQPELLALVRHGRRWEPRAVIFPQEEPPILLGVFLAMWPDIERIEPTYPEAQGPISVSLPRFSGSDPAGRRDLDPDLLDARDISFVVLGGRRPRAGSEITYPYVSLKPDRRDDAAIESQFLMAIHFTRSTYVEVGNIKILREGQRDGRTFEPGETFSRLPENYYSLGQSYTFYETLNNLGSRVYKPILRRLRDLVFTPSLRRRFESEYAFEYSLIRTGKAARALEDAGDLFEIDGPDSEHKVNFKFSTSVGGDRFQIEFKFGDRPRIPNRINAIIGYNGTGKTHLLAHLAIVASSDLEQRRDLADRFGQFTESETLRFSSVIAISYSAFDTFPLPNSFWAAPRRNSDPQYLIDDGEYSGYTYCGLRTRIDDPEIQAKNPRALGLKSYAEITSDFTRAVLRAQSTRKRKLWAKALEIVQSEPSFSRIDTEIFSEHGGRAWRAQFNSMSTGHKIVLNIVAQTISYAEPGSLILIDEPESHLHPSLLAALVRVLTTILKSLESHAIVATHSPVVLQEIPRHYVHILQRFGEKSQVASPKTETFGENVGYLTTHVFDLDSTQTDYHSVLAKLSEDTSVDDIDDLFDGDMSLQARAYVIGLQGRRSR